MIWNLEPSSHKRKTKHVARAVDIRKDGMFHHTPPSLNHCATTLVVLWLLGRAVNKVFDKFNGESYTKTVGLTETKVGNSDKNVLDTSGSVPDWAKVLDLVRKLPTNVGARIWNLTIDALQKNPPQWARKLLKTSISKEVYKRNASGPTKGVEEQRTPELIITACSCI
ncbi:hypothetical protein OROHE_016470 [Orobanche hederae]